MKSTLLIASVGLVAGIAACANATVIVNQPNDTGNGYTSQNFTDYTAYSGTCFDDFTLNSTWDMTSLTVYGVDNGNSAFNVAVSAWIGTTAGWHTGTMVSGVQVGNDLVFNLTGITLGAGTYWVSAEVERPFAGGGQWYWGSSSTTNGSTGLYQNPGGGFGVGTGVISNGAFNGGVATDMAFTLQGDKVPAPGAIALIGLAGLMGRRRR